MKLLSYLLLSLIICFAAACGQPGPLYLPKDEPVPLAPSDDHDESSTDLQAPPESTETTTDYQTDSY